MTVSLFLFSTYFTYELWDNFSNSCSFSLERPTIMTGSIIHVAIVGFDIYAYSNKAQGGASNEQGRGSVRVRVRNIARAISHFLTSIVHFKFVFFDMIPSWKCRQQQNGAWA